MGGGGGGRGEVKGERETGREGEGGRGRGEVRGKGLERVFYILLVAMHFEATFLNSLFNTSGWRV